MLGIEFYFLFYVLFKKALHVLTIRIFTITCRVMGVKSMPVYTQGDGAEIKSSVSSLSKKPKPNLNLSLIPNLYTLQGLKVCVLSVSCCTRKRCKL